MKEDLYTAYYAAPRNEEIVADRDVEIPGMEEEIAAVEPDISVMGMKPINSHNDGDRKKEQTDITGKSDFLKTKETELVYKSSWIVKKISELGGYENVGAFVKADIFGFDIVDVSGSIRLFSDVMKRLGIKQDGDELYEEFQRTYDESVGRNADKEKVEDKMWSSDRGR